MMKCEDCIHFDKCSDTYEYIFGNKYENEVENICNTFKDKSLFVELPCKVGDKVYVIADGIWHCQEVWQFRYDICGLFVKTVGIYPYDFEWGETAFLTREEAEKKLKELQE